MSTFTTDSLMMNVGQQSMTNIGEQSTSPSHNNHSTGLSNNSQSTSFYNSTSGNQTVMEPNNSQQQQQQQQLAHNASNSAATSATSTNNGNLMNNTGMGSNTGNTQVLQELFRQQHLQTQQQSMNYQQHSPQMNNNNNMQHSNTSNFQNTSIDSNNTNHHNVGTNTTTTDYNLLLNMVARSEPVVSTNDQEFMMQHILQQQQAAQHMMPQYHSPHPAAIGLPHAHHHPMHTMSLTQPSMMHHHHPMHTLSSHPSVQGLQTSYGNETYPSSIPENYLSNFLNENQENVNNGVSIADQNNQSIANLQLSHNTSNGWRNDDKMNFSYFDSVTPYVEHSQNNVVDTSQMVHTNNDVVTMTNVGGNTAVGDPSNGYMKRPSPPPSMQIFHENSYSTMNGGMMNYSSQPIMQQAHITQPTQVLGTTMNNGVGNGKKSKLVNDSPKLKEVVDDGRESTNCHCCGRSDAEVSFKKNYSIHEGNIESYRNTFPQNIDQITSGPVCATCYNKQWRFQRGLYDPQKMRKANPREGLKQRLKDGDSSGSPLTPTMASFPVNNRLSAIQSDYSPTSSPKTSSLFLNKNKRKSTSSLTITTSAHSNDLLVMESYDPASKRSKGVGGDHSESSLSKYNLPARNIDPDEISIIVQFYQVDNNTSEDSFKLVDTINEFNQAQIRSQKQQMFGIYPNDRDSEACKHVQQFYTTAMKINRKHFDVINESSTLQHVQGKIALENMKQLLIDRAKQHKQSKVEDPKTSTSTSNDETLPTHMILCMKISSLDRFRNVVMADVDEFFFVDKKLSEGDSIHVFLN